MKNTFLYILFFLSISLFAQKEHENEQFTTSELKHKYNTYSFHAGYGISNALTDLKAFRFYPARIKKDELRFAYYGSFNRQLRYAFGISSNLVVGSFAGSLRINQDNFLLNTKYYNSRYVANNYLFDYNISSLYGKCPPPKIQFIAHAGIGWLAFNSKQQFLQNDSTLATVGSTNSNTGVRTPLGFSLEFPLGLSIDIKLTKRFDLRLNSFYTFTTTDKIDAFVGDLRKVKTDSYFLGNLMMSYKLGNKQYFLKWDVPFDGNACNEPTDTSSYIKPGSVRGRVINPVTNKSAPNVELEIKKEDGSRLVIKTDELGRFVYRGVTAQSEIQLRYAKTQNSPDSLILENSKNIPVGMVYLQSKRNPKFNHTDPKLGSLINIHDSIQKTVISGQLVGSNNSVLSNKKLVLLSRSGKPISQTQTDNFGRFSFTNIPADQNYLLKIDEAESAIANFAHVKYNDALSNQLLTLLRENKFAFSVLNSDQNNFSGIKEAPDSVHKYTFRGKLVDGNGNPIKNIVIKCQDKNGTPVNSIVTDELGRFAYTTLNADELYYFIVNEADPSLSGLQHILVQDLNDSVVIKLSESDKFKFSLLGSSQNNITLINATDPSISKMIYRGKLSSTANKPLANKTIKAINDKGELLATTISDEYGRFAFKNLQVDESILIVLDEKDPELKNVRVQVSDHQGKVVAFIDETSKFSFRILVSDQNNINYIQDQIVDSNLVAYRGKLTNRKGVPFANKIIRLKDINGKVVATTTSDDLGRFLFKNLVADESLLLSIDVNNLDVSEGVVVLMDWKNNLVQELSSDNKYQFRLLTSDQNYIDLIEVQDAVVGLAIFAGKIKDASGKPLKKTMLILKNEKGVEIASTISDKDGKFVFKNLMMDELMLFTIDAADHKLSSGSYTVFDMRDRPVVNVAVKDRFVFRLLSSPQNDFTAIINSDLDFMYNAPLAGIVKDEKGNPIDGVVMLVKNAAGKIVDKIKTNEKGYYEYRSINVDSSYYLSVDATDPLLAAYNKVAIADAKSGNTVTANIKGNSQTTGVKNTSSVAVSLLRDTFIVYFDFDGYSLTTEAEQAILLLSEKMIAVKSVELNGHTDATGPVYYNMILSEKRTKAVAEKLKTINSEIKLNMHWFGEIKPTYPNENPDGSDDPIGRQKNRRVQIIITK